MSADAPVTFRAATPADLDAIHAMNLRAERADRLPIATPRGEWDEWLDDPHLDLAADTRVAWAGDAIVAWGRVWHRPSGTREARAYVMGAVDPEHRGRGIGRALLAWEIERAEQVVRRAPAGLPRFVRAQAYDFQRDALRLYQRHGLTPVRYQDELLLDLAEPARPVPGVPGVTVTPWDPARSEEARHVHNHAFLDHWGTTPLDAPAWEHALRSAGSRLDLSFLAVEAGRVVGVCRNAHFPGDEAVTGRRDGWIFQVSVARAHRRRGIASALIAASLEAFRRAGFTHSALGVDSANPSGAYGLYTRLGYRPAHRSVVCQREA